MIYVFITVKQIWTFALQACTFLKTFPNVLIGKVEEMGGGYCRDWPWMGEDKMIASAASQRVSGCQRCRS